MAHPMAVSLDNMQFSPAMPGVLGRKSEVRRDARPRNQGLFRTVMAGPGHTLADVFANLELAPQLERVLRHAKRDLLSARISLPSEEG